MKINQKMLSVFTMLMVMLLCCVNITYAWESLHQTALNVYVEEAETEEPPNPDETPDEKPKPEPEKPSSKPGSTSKPEKPTDHETPKDEPAKVPEGTIQNGKYQMTTGDTCEFVFYMVIMLISFTVIIILGAVLMALALHEWEKRKQR